MYTIEWNFEIKSAKVKVTGNENIKRFRAYLREKWKFGELVALLVARRTNNRNSEGYGSRLTKVVCITVLTGNRLG